MKKKFSNDPEPYKIICHTCGKKMYDGEMGGECGECFSKREMTLEEMEYKDMLKDEKESES